MVDDRNRSADQLLNLSEKEPRAHQGRLRRGAYLLPSLITMANLFCGYACIIYSLQGDFSTAAAFIGIAIVLDMLDGRIARMTRTSSEFGLQFDSLADAISFGVAPAILVFTWGLHPLGRLGWAAGFIFVAATVVRLARFNIQRGTHDKYYFVGMPSPAAAGVPAATVFALSLGFQSLLPAQIVLVLGVVLVPALLMVSTIRFRSFKALDFQTRKSYPVLVMMAVGLALLVAETQLVLVVMAYSYLISPLIETVWQRIRRRTGHVDERTSIQELPVSQEDNIPFDGKA